MAETAARPGRIPRFLLWMLVCLCAYKLVYHSLYVRDSAFAVATFSDGRLYEEAARDLLARPPLGTRPFYLQGLYAYFMALAMGIKPVLAAALLLQLVAAGFSFLLFFRAARDAFGPLAGALSTVVLLAHPTLTFYENKYLSAELGIICNVAVLFAFASYARAPGGVWAFGLGAASSLSLLARPNMALALPATLWAVALIGRTGKRGSGRDLAVLVLGALLTLAPMAVRNQLVTRHPDVFPSHGGGTSFYIGNNPHATGLWNSAGGLFSGQVGVERWELQEQLGIDAADRREQARAVGRTLYRRAFRFIAERPMSWLGLEARKLWYVAGNDEITQDYDVFGEREIVSRLYRIGLPFGVLLALGAFGFWILAAGSRSTTGAVAARKRAWLWVAGGQLLAALAANLLFFTSAQHRLPLAVPLAFVSGPALLAMRESIRKRGKLRPATWAALGICLLLFAQSFWPRTARRTPSSAHYYNLSVVQHEAGEVEAAIETLDIAIARRPDQPEFILDHARLARELGRFEQAQADLDRLAARERLPGWLLRQAVREQTLLVRARRGAAPSH